MLRKSSKKFPHYDHSFLYIQRSCRAILKTTGILYRRRIAEKRFFHSHPYAHGTFYFFHSMAQEDGAYYANHPFSFFHQISFSIKKGDIVFLQRTVYNKYFFVIMVAYLFIFRRKMIFDFDDPIYTHNFLKTKTFCQMADAVITCTHEQAKWARQFNHNVHIIHIAIDPTPYEKFSKNYLSY